jgi:hypothetical protein
MPPVCRGRLLILSLISAAKSAFGLCYEAIIVVRPTDDTAVHPQQARILSPSRGCAHSVKHSNLLQTKERDRSMQRLATYFTGPQATSSHQFRSFSTRHTGWPYSPSADAQSHASTSGSVSSSPAHQAAKTSLSKPTVGLSKTVHDILEQIKHLKGAREMWEVCFFMFSCCPSSCRCGGCAACSYGHC